LAAWVTSTETLWLSRCLWNARSRASVARRSVSLKSTPSRPVKPNFRSETRCWLPTLEVMMITAFWKFTVRPCASVSRPSSRICKNMLNTSGCAFSISSNKTTLYGRRLTASVSCPASS
jgi:hypothetical protein